MILRLRAGSETLILGPRAAFAAVAGRDRGALVSEYEVRRRLRIALADPEGADALRRAFARWREEGARIREADDRALIDRVARMSRGGMIVAFVVADRTKRLPRPETRPAPEPLRPAASSDPQLARMTFDRRIAATLERVPNHLTGPAKQEFLALIEPQALAITAGVLAIWAASHAVGVGEAIDVILAVVGLVFAGPEFWRGLEALFRALTLVRTAQSETELDEAAAIFAAGVAKVGIAVLIAAITRGAAKKAARWTEKKPGLRNTPQERSVRPERQPLSRARPAAAEDSTPAAASLQSPPPPPKKQSLREKYLGRTPGKNSATGRAVIDRMESEGKIRTDPLSGNREFLSSDGRWYDIAEADMSHKTDAVGWWNSTGRNFGEKTPEVRAWMRDPANYELEHFSTNRSRGAILGQSQNYLPPAGDPPP